MGEGAGGFPGPPAPPSALRGRPIYSHLIESDGVRCGIEKKKKKKKKERKKKEPADPFDSGSVGLTLTIRVPFSIFTGMKVLFAYDSHSASDSVVD